MLTRDLRRAKDRPLPQVPPTRPPVPAEVRRLRWLALSIRERPLRQTA